MGDSPLRSRRSRSKSTEEKELNPDSAANTTASEDSSDNEEEQFNVAYKRRGKPTTVKKDGEEGGGSGRGTPSSMNDFFKQQGTPKGQRKPQKSFDDFVKEDEKKGLFKKNKSMEDFSYKGKIRQDGSWLDKALLMIVLIGLGVVGYWFLISVISNDLSNGPTKMTWKELEEEAFKQFQQLHKKFPSQSRETMISALSAVQSTLKEQEPKQPSCLVLLATEDLVKTSFPSCLAKQISKIANDLLAKVNGSTPENALIMNTAFFRTYGNNITELYEKIRSYFKTGGRSIVVEDITALKEESHLLLFHGLCDNFAAPEKRASLFFIVPVPQNTCTQDDQPCSNPAELAYNLLDSAWKRISNDDSRPAVIARVAALSVMLSKGDSC